MFTKGDILQANHRKFTEGYHYIIFYEGHSKNNFIGGMITHRDINKNIPMLRGHFNEIDGDGKEFKVQYDKTFLVNAKLMKPERWGPYNKVGALTQEGIDFFEKVIENLPLETFAHYYKRINNYQ